MKKVLMVIFVLSLLGLMAAPVLAKVFTGGPSNEIAPPPGHLHPAGREDQMLAEGLIKEGPPPNELCPPPRNLHSAGGEDPVQVAGIGGGFYPPAPRS